MALASRGGWDIEHMMYVELKLVVNKRSDLDLAALRPREAIYPLALSRWNIEHGDVAKSQLIFARNVTAGQGNQKITCGIPFGSLIVHSLVLFI